MARFVFILLLLCCGMADASVPPHRANLSGTMDGAGGIGGLVAIREHGAGTYHFTCYDGNGNVMALVNAGDQSISAQYEYSPFGELIRATGPMSKANPLRFSTKYQDDETDLNYYGYRYYSASLGRWINKDPLGEAGRVNIYKFAWNSPFNYVDLLGLISGIADDTDEEQDERLDMVGTAGYYAAYAYNKEMRDWNKRHRNRANCELKEAAEGFAREAALQLAMSVLAPEAEALARLAALKTAWLAQERAMLLKRGLLESWKKSLIAAKEAPVIIGENMNRVNAYAGKVGGETIDGWLAGRKWTQQLNDEFIATMKAQGRQIQDIGPDFGRRLQNRIDSSFGRPPSSVYGGERQSLLDYGNYQRLYERTDKYQGGVPGFDP